MHWIFITQSRVINKFIGIEFRIFRMNYTIRKNFKKERKGRKHISSNNNNNKKSKQKQNIENESFKERHNLNWGDE